MDGREFSEQMHAHRPALKVVFMSGYNTELAGRMLTLRPGQKFIQKPCTPDLLLETVRRCLDES